MITLPAPEVSSLPAVQATARGIDRARRIVRLNAVISGVIVGVLAAIILMVATSEPLVILIAVLLGAATFLIVHKARSNQADERIGVIFDSIAPDTGTRNERLDNMIDAVSLRSGVPAPAPRIVNSPAPNVSIAATSLTDSCLFITEGLLELADPLMIEGAIARAVQMVESGTAIDVTWSLALDGMMFAGRVPGPAPIDDIVGTADLDALTVTNYPPALAGLLEKLVESDPYHGWPGPIDDLSLLPGSAVPLSVAERAAIIREF